MPSIIFDSKADLLVYGMGELQTIEIAKRLSEGYPVESLYDIRGVCYKIRTDDYVPKSVVELPSYERVKRTSVTMQLHHTGSLRRLMP